MDRHYGLDWLRIGAFGLLIFYHIGMVFVPWDYHVKLAADDWVVIPMLATNAWRLMLLFVVSGYASRALMIRSNGLAAFARNRTFRLLVPLAFGVAVIVPPQVWAELASKYGYARGFFHFWARDYFGFDTIGRIAVPTWNHLWFVGYLWLYTIALTLIAALAGRFGNMFQRVGDWLFAGPLLFLVPTVYLLFISGWAFAGQSETHALIDDGVAHASYLPMFLFGFWLAGSESAIDRFRRLWPVTALLALIAYAVVAGVEIAWPGGAPYPWGRIFSLGKGVQGWMTIAALIGLAEAYLNRDHPWRRTLTEAVFPFYIIHQTVIVVVAYWLRSAALPLAADFAILVVTTVSGCWAFYLVGRSVGWLRPLIGLRPRVHPRGDMAFA